MSRRVGDGPVLPGDSGEEPPGEAKVSGASRNGARARTCVGVSAPSEGWNPRAARVFPTRGGVACVCVCARVSV